VTLIGRTVKLRDHCHSAYYRCYCNDVTNRQSGKMRNAEYAKFNNEATMHSVTRHTHIVKHFINVFRPVYISVKTLVCHVNYRNIELTLSLRINVKSSCSGGRRSQKFVSEGDKTWGLGTEVPQRGPGAEPW